MANFGNKGGKKPSGRSGGRSGPSSAPPAAQQHVEPRCKICTSDHRREVDMMLTTGWTQAEVQRWLNATEGFEEGDDGWFSPKNLSNHARRHLDLKDRAVRRIIEDRARQMGLDVEHAEGFLLTRESMLELVAKNGLDAMLQGQTTAQPQDVIAAVKQLADFERETRETAVNEMLNDYSAFADAVKEVLKEVAGVLGRPVEEIMQDLARRYERNLERQKPALELNPGSFQEEDAP